MSDAEPSEAERDGLEAVRAVVAVTAHERLEPSGKTRAGTGDWRVWMADGRVADMEVTTFTDSDVRSFSAQLHKKDGSFKTWGGRETFVRMDRPLCLTVTQEPTRGVAR